MARCVRHAYVSKRDEYNLVPIIVRQTHHPPDSLVSPRPNEEQVERDDRADDERDPDESNFGVYLGACTFEDLLGGG